MPIIIEWGNDARTIIHARTEGTYTWEEYHQTTADVQKLLSDKVKGIVNIWEAGAKMPEGNPLPHFRQMIEATLPKYNFIVVNVGHKGYEQMVVEIAEKAIPLLQNRVLYANTIEEAHQIIETR